MQKLPIGCLGRILAGPEKGRVMEIVDDSDRTGGFLVLTYSDFNRSPEVFDVWFESYDDLLAGFEETGWQVEWQPSASCDSR